MKKQAPSPYQSCSTSSQARQKTSDRISRSNPDTRHRKRHKIAQEAAHAQQSHRTDQTSAPHKRNTPAAREHHSIIHQANTNTAEHHARQDAARATTGTACTSSRHITQPSTEPPHSHAQNSSTSERTHLPQQGYNESLPPHPWQNITEPITRPLSAPEPPLSPARAPRIISKASMTHQGKSGTHHPPNT